MNMKKIQMCYHLCSQISELYVKSYPPKNQHIPEDIKGHQMP